MPNTIIHIAAQTVATPPSWRPSSGWMLQWVLLGAMLPDVPWILQRALRPIAFVLRGVPGVEGDPILAHLRLYAGVQASLLFCLLLSLAVALLSRHPKRTFSILAWGSALHLLLDALQIKWANGVLLFAPFDWSLWGFEYFWPESWQSDLMTAISLVGAAIIVWALANRPAKDWPLVATRWKLVSVVLFLWLVGPFLFMGELRKTNAFSIQALSQAPSGQMVELGVATVFESSRGLSVLTLTERELRLESSDDLPKPGKVSLVGQLIAGSPDPEDRSETDVLMVENFHQHRPRRRELSSTLGLLFIAGAWILQLKKSRSRTAS